jgi:hypothetical protein
VSDRPDLARAVTAALEARGVTCTPVPAGDRVPTFEQAGAALAAVAERAGSLDGVVVALSGGAHAPGPAEPWERILVEHAGIVDGIRADAAWARAVADHARATERPVRLVTLTDATTAGGRSRAQAAAQHARAALGATRDRVAAFAVAVEATGAAVTGPEAELAAHLVAGPDPTALSGAELVAADGWVGVRSHPHPGGCITFGGPGLPPWFDDALRRLVGAEPA